MAINTQVMLNSIASEIREKGKSSRLLPVQLAEALQSKLAVKYTVMPDGSLSNGNTVVTFTQGTCGVKVVFTAITASV